MLSGKRNPKARPAWGRYAFAIGSVVLGLFAREALTPAVGPTALPFLSFFPAVAMAAWYGGFGPGAVATVLGAVAANWFFLEPLHTFRVRSSYDVAALTGFSISCLFIIGAMEAMHRANARARAELNMRERVEEELVREKELLATTLASIGDGVIVTDADGRVTFLNGEAERLTGWKNAEADSHPLTEIFRIINEETRQPVENPVEKALRLGSVVGLANHTLLLARDGREVPIDDSAAPIRQPGGCLFGVVLVFRDFTEHKQTEARLQELALFPAQNPAPILRLARNGTLLHANPAAFDRLHDWNLAVGQAAPAQLFSLAADALNAEKAVERELIIGKRIYLMSIVPVPEVGYANLYGLDVTERKHAEDALRDAHEQLGSRAIHLESLVQQRTARLNEMIGDLEAFSYSIVHDMRGPLRAMQSFAQLLAEECGHISPAAGDYVRRIKTAAERMDHLIQDGLNYSRVMRAELPLTPTDVGELLRGIVETYPAFQPPQAEIELENNFPLVRANEAALTQVISNLLGNAVKFVAPGVTPRVRAWAETRDGRVRLLFKDNGIGIEMEAHEKIFQIFQRLDDKYEGTGIGLAIVKKAAERMGGSIGIESAPGRGSTFWMELASASDEKKRTTSQVAPAQGDISQ